jgi:hypothetical protein
MTDFTISGFLQDLQITFRWCVDILVARVATLGHECDGLPCGERAPARRKLCADIACAKKIENTGRLAGRTGICCPSGQRGISRLDHPAQEYPADDVLRVDHAISRLSPTMRRHTSTLQSDWPVRVSSMRPSATFQRHYGLRRSLPELTTAWGLLSLYGEGARKPCTISLRRCTLNRIMQRPTLTLELCWPVGVDSRNP